MRLPDFYQTFSVSSVHVGSSYGRFLDKNKQPMYDEETGWQAAAIHVHRRVASHPKQD